MKSGIIGLLVSLLMLGATSAGAADAPKIGTVDIQKVLFNSEAGKTAKEQLAGKIAKHESEKNSREDDLKKLKADLEKQNILLNETARNAKEKDYQQKLKEYQRFIKDVNDELQAKDEELKNKIIEEAFKTTQEYGKKNGFSLIVAKSEMLMYMDENIDLTDEIVKQMNSKKDKK
ncbi:OmpH family outer membrane protein [Geobacter pelophilus]|uniref:OmpH family outer membrane protein n=1 Tax=Geoanaerobacter pelophilus TaxID=60036 RepID=A0AAW4LAE7_9BACT|nr:OmpH family outer membrane protein [Geoanaerobacter pelophilus]MBT0665545.1 OmpH family outer membrane protein [Geoanaerobacter pelophilus]